MKNIIFTNDAKKSLAKGAETLAKAVVSTLGPRSRNVAIQRRGMTPLVAHDGVTVARSVVPLKDPFENLGAELLKEASTNTNELAGDGTTTATLLANELIQGGLLLTGGGIVDGEIRPDINPMVIRERFNESAEKICNALDKKAKKLKKGDILSIAKISSASDEIAQLVVESIDKVGESGLVMAGNSETFRSYVEYKEGMEFDNGYLSPYFVTNPAKMTVEYPEALILFADKVISDPAEIAPLLEKIIKEHNGQVPLVIVANDVVGFALQGLILLKQKGTVGTCAIMAPEYADRRKEMLEDLALITGGVVLSPDKKDDIRNAEIKHLGRASIRVTQTHTIITPKYPDKEEIEERAQFIKEQIKSEQNAFRKERLEWRLAKLTQGVAVIRVGGGSEAEVNDKKLRIEDAIHAVRAGLQEGAIVGGGITLSNIGYELFDTTDPIDTLILKTLNKPFEILMQNSGLDPDWVANEISKDIKNNTFDVVNNKPVDGFKAGIIDPVKVTKLAVRHAFSVAGMFLTTETLIVEEENKDIQKIRVVNNEGV